MPETSDESVARELAEALQSASAETLSRIAVDIAPLLFTNYDSEPRGGDALARPRSGSLPSFLVRVHPGPFTDDDFASLREAARSAGVSQCALAVIAIPPMSATLRSSFGPFVPWVLDRDGLVRLMLAHHVGIAVRVVETKYVNPAYFR
jgi:hypothetical protein